jgi:hypothetical protein
MKGFLPLCWCPLAFGLFFPAAAAPPSLELLTLTADHQLALRLNGSDALRYALDTSTNLLDWSQSFLVTTTNQTATFQFSPGDTPNALFFRAREISSVVNLSLIPFADTNHSVSALVTQDGGHAELLMPNGVSIVLNVSTGAVMTPQVISMTLITNLAGLPFAAGTFGAVSLEPSGLRTVASLQIFYPPGLDRRQVASFRADNNGANFRLAWDRARSNHVVIPVPIFGIYGSSIASLPEIDVAAQYEPLYDAPAPAPSPQALGSVAALSTPRGGACWGDTFDSENFLQSTKDCFEDRILRAVTVRCQIERAWEAVQAGIGRDLIAARQAQLMGSTDDDPGSSVLENVGEQICLFYAIHIGPLWPQAASDCASSFMLLNFATSFSRSLQLIGTDVSCVPDLGLMGGLACAGIPACLDEVKQCCERGKKGGGRMLEILSMAREFQLVGAECFNPYGGETEAARNACLSNAWIGTFTLTYIDNHSTNFAGSDGSTISEAQLLEMRFSGGVYDFTESGFPGSDTNLFLQTSGLLAAQKNVKSDRHKTISCNPDPDVQQYQIHTTDAAVSTNFLYDVNIGIDPAGHYQLSAFNPGAIKTIFTDHQMSASPACSGYSPGSIDFTSKLPGYFFPPLITTPISRTLSNLDEISGSADLPVESTPTARLHVEWNFRRNVTTSP